MAGKNDFTVRTLGSRTQYKLEEARFFLAQVENAWRHLAPTDFFLSAFVSAARSVTWIMRAEYSHVPGWKEWFESRRPSPQIRELLRAMSDLRNRVTKVAPVRSRVGPSISIPAESMDAQTLELLQSPECPPFRLIPVDDRNEEFDVVVGEQIVGRGSLNHVRHRLPEFEDRDARGPCREYLEVLEQLVSECRERFPVGPREGDGIA